MVFAIFFKHFLRNRNYTYFKVPQEQKKETGFAVYCVKPVSFCHMDFITTF